MYRLLALAGLIALVVFAVKRFTGSARRATSADASIMPFCTKCESNRNVVDNRGGHPHYPKDQYPWFCQHCEEAF
jgi:hypothetical protein